MDRAIRVTRDVARVSVARAVRTAFWACAIVAKGVVDQGDVE
jgi:hypothetical protein